MTRHTHPTSSGILISIGAAFSLTFAIIVATSSAPLATAFHFFAGPFLNRYHLGNLLDGASLLIVTGFGVAVAFRSGTFNLGGEGQTYLGSVVAAQVAVGMIHGGETQGVIGAVLALGAASIAGGAVGGVSGALRANWDIDELVSSFLLSSALIPIIDFALSGPLRDSSGYLLSTPLIPSSLRLLRLLPPSTLNTGIILSISTLLIGSWMLHRTLPGFELRMTGSGRGFARYSGVRTSRYLFVGMLVSGLLHGFAGGLHVLGTRHSAMQGGTGGLGWNGIAVALIAENRPLALIPAALVFSYLMTATQTAMLNSGFSLDLSAVVQGVVFLLITVKRFGRSRD